MARHLFKPEIRNYIHERYLQGEPARVISQELREKFSLDIPAVKIRHLTSRAGLASKKAAIEQKVGTLVTSAKIETVARTRALDPSKALEEWAERAANALDKALTMVETAKSPRELAPAINAAQTALKMVTRCTGLDSTRGADPRRPVLINLGSVHIPLATPQPGDPVSLPAPAPSVSSSRLTADSWHSGDPLPFRP